MSLVRSGFLISVLGLGLLWSGVAAAEPAHPAISLRVADLSYNLWLSGNAVGSLNIELYRSETVLRGRALGVIANLSLEEDGVFGSTGGAPVNVKVRKQGDTLLAEGGFMGGPVQLRFSPKELQVYINDCRYELTYTQDHYEGGGNCAPRLQLTVPAVLLKRGPSEQAALLLFAFAYPQFN